MTDKASLDANILDLGLYVFEKEKFQKAEDIVIAPKVILASALFTTRNNNQPRAYFKNREIAVAPGLGSLHYMGEELRYNDMEVWQVIIEFSRKDEIHTKNYVLTTNIYKILKALEWRTSGREYDLFKDCLQRLKANAITAISESNAIKSVSLISKFIIKESSELEIHLDPEIYKLFKAEQLALLSSKALKNMPALTRKVYEILKTELTECLTVATYMELSGNNYKHVRQFKPRLIASLKQLQAGGYIIDWSIDKTNLVSIKLKNDMKILNSQYGMLDSCLE